MIELAVLMWIFCGIGAAFVAQSRGASGCLWFGLGVLFGPFGLALAFISGSDRRCPHCRERIHPEATRCPNCQANVAPEMPGVGGTAPNAILTGGRSTVESAARAMCNDAIKKCPDCAEDVRAESRKCRFCGFVFPEPPAVDQSAQLDAEPVSESTIVTQQLAPVPSPPQTGPVAPPAPVRSNAFRTSRYGWLILAGSVVGLYLYIRSMQDHTTSNPVTVEPPVREMNAVETSVMGSRTRNTISVDTWGCRTFEIMVRRAGSTMPSVGGCIDLNRGRAVIGPLEIKTDKNGMKFARIEVPGKGEVWTFYSHLAT